MLFVNQEACHVIPRSHYTWVCTPLSTYLHSWFGLVDLLTFIWHNFAISFDIALHLRQSNSSALTVGVSGHSPQHVVCSPPFKLNAYCLECHRSFDVDFSSSTQVLKRSEWLWTLIGVKYPVERDTGVRLTPSNMFRNKLRLQEVSKMAIAVWLEFSTAWLGLMASGMNVECRSAVF